MSAEIDVMTKPCIKCGRTERALNGQCKPCKREKMSAALKADPEKFKLRRAAFRKANFEKLKADGVAYRKANPEKVKATKAAFYAANKGKVKSQASVWARLNPEKRKASCAKWLANNIEKHNAAVKAWNAANPGAMRVFKHNRRAREREAGGKLSKGLAVKLFKLQRGKCACCGKPLGSNYHLDHRMPIALGGANEDSNMQLLTQRCNNQKWKKHPVDFMQSRGFLL